MHPSPSPQYVPEPKPERAPRAPFAPVTTVLVVLNVAIFIVELIIARDPFDMVFFTKHSAEHAMMVTGANYWWATVHENRFETLLASCFVHGGLLHVGFNVVALRQIGPVIERAAGSARMLPLYFISGIVGSFLSTFVHLMRGNDSLGVGASGAICGLIGAALVIGYRVEGWKSPMLRAMASWLATIFVIGFVPGIDGMAHAGGAIAGAVIAFLWRRGFKYSRAREATVYTMCALVLLATAARVAVADLTVPWSTYTFTDRLRAADDALYVGDCATARSAVSAARRLIPAAPEIVHADEVLRERCR